VPAELERIISKCLEKDRNLRYQHAADVRADLQRMKRQTEATGRPIVTKAEAPALDGTCQKYEDYSLDTNSW